MARENIVRAYDDQERKKNPESTAQATRQVEIEVKVFDIDGKFLPDESLERRQVDLMAANLDTVKSGAYKAWEAGKRATGSNTSSSTPRSSSRSSNRSSGSRGGSGSQASQKQAFNKGVREYAATQPKWSEVQPQGRLPGALIEEFKAANPNWAQTYFNGNPPEDQKTSAEQPAPAEPTSDVEPSPEPVTDGPVQDDSYDEDPPLDQTNDADWTGPNQSQYV